MTEKEHKKEVPVGFVKSVFMWSLYFLINIYLYLSTENKNKETVHNKERNLVSFCIYYIIWISVEFITSLFGVLVCFCFAHNLIARIHKGGLFLIRALNSVHGLK